MSAFRLWGIRFLGSQNLWGDSPRYIRGSRFSQPRPWLWSNRAVLAVYSIVWTSTLSITSWVLSLSCFPTENRTFFVSYQRSPLVFTLSFKLSVNYPQLSIVHLNCSAIPLSFLRKDANQRPRTDLIPHFSFPGHPGNSSAGDKRWVSTVLLRWWGCSSSGTSFRSPDPRSPPSPPFQIPLEPQASASTTRVEGNPQLQSLSGPIDCCFLPRGGEAGLRI